MHGRHDCTATTLLPSMMYAGKAAMPSSARNGIRVQCNAQKVCHGYKGDCSIRDIYELQEVSLDDHTCQLRHFNAQ